MNYSKCKCGETEWFGSDPPRACQRCPDCGTGPGGREPEFHDPKPRFSSSTGAQVGYRCSKCMKRVDADGKDV